MTDLVFPVRVGSTVFIDHTVNANKEMLCVNHSLGVKKIVTLTSGTDHIDLFNAKNLGIEIENRPGLNAPAVAQWMLTQALDYCEQQKPRWELQEKNCLVIGSNGCIGRELNTWISPMVWDTAYQGYTIDNLKEKLQRADFVFLCIPAEHNKDFIDFKLACCFKPGAVLINISRPSVIADSALNAFATRGIVYVWDFEHIAWWSTETIKKQEMEIEKAKE